MGGGVEAAGVRGGRVGLAGGLYHRHMKSASAELIYSTTRRVMARQAVRLNSAQATLSRDSLLVRASDSWSKGCEFESRQERRGNFLLRCQLCVLTLTRRPFHPRVTAVAHKRPRSVCHHKCRWQVTPKHANTFDPIEVGEG